MLLIVRVNFGLSLPPSLPPLPLSFLPCLPLRSSLPRHVNAIPCNLFNLPPFLPTLLLWHSFQCYVDFFFSSFLALSYLFHVFFFSLVCLDKYVFVSRSSFHFMLFNSQLSFAFWFSSSPLLSSPLLPPCLLHFSLPPSFPPSLPRSLPQVGYLAVTFILQRVNRSTRPFRWPCAEFLSTVCSPVGSFYLT